MTSISIPFLSVLVLFLFAIITQASLLDPSQSDVSLLDRLRLETDLQNGASLLREILESKTSHAQLQDLERLTEHYRSKRCRWKLCGTGRRFRFN
uniref:WSN domain-containing protein n=1 Tax=Caenorhabditis tropicalis TaxID=1561998 RepID=A0A1I7TB81_9PELO